MYPRYGKRALDLVLSAGALLLLSPLIAVLALLVRTRLGAPVLFRQQRPGLGGIPFILYKFRTMTDDRDVQGRPLSDTERLTPFGRFLRSTSLDELPELLNVLHGKMSLVGPRPLLVQYLERYTPEQARRHEVTPGITGWAQVNGRNTLTWEQKFALDVWYVDHMSLSAGREDHRLDHLEDHQARGYQPARSGHSRRVYGDSIMSTRVLILGAGGHAQVVADILLRARDAGHRSPRSATSMTMHPCTAKCFWICPSWVTQAHSARIPHDAIIIAIGNNQIRKRLADELSAAGETFATACHPTAIIAPDVRIGPGVMICAGVVVNTGSVIGTHVILNTGCTVDHHNSIGSYAHVAPGTHMGGEVVIEEGALVGIGAIVAPRTSVGAWATVGTGAVVIEARSPRCDSGRCAGQATTEELR